MYPEDWECPTAWYLLGSADMAGWALLDAAGVPDCEQAWTNFSLDATKAGFYRYCCCASRARAAVGDEAEAPALSPPPPPPRGE